MGRELGRALRSKRWCSWTMPSTSPVSERKGSSIGKTYCVQSVLRQSASMDPRRDETTYLVRHKPRLSHSRLRLRIRPNAHPVPPDHIQMRVRTIRCESRLSRDDPLLVLKMNGKSPAVDIRRIPHASSKIAVVAIVAVDRIVDIAAAQYLSEFQVVLRCFAWGAQRRLPEDNASFEGRLEDVASLCVGVAEPYLVVFLGLWLESGDVR